MHATQTARTFLRNQAIHLERRSRKLYRDGKVDLATRMLTRAEAAAALAFGCRDCAELGLALLGVEVRP